MTKSSITMICLGVALLPAQPLAQDEPNRPINRSVGPVIELESRVTGNREQPQVFHVVPWQSPDSPMPAYDPLQSQLQDVFGHLERDELHRQLEFERPVQD